MYHNEIKQLAEKAISELSDNPPDRGLYLESNTESAVEDRLEELLREYNVIKGNDKMIFGSKNP